MARITKYSGKDVIHAKTKSSSPDPKVADARWWLRDKESELASSLFGVVKYLKDNQGFRQNQAALFARMYGNMPLWNYLGINLTKINSQYKFPSDRPTMNVVQSCTDALVARMVQSKPKPMFLTEAGNYKKRKIAKELNKFVDGEFYQTRAYETGEVILRDGCVLGDGVVKVYETDENKVGLERVLETELFVDEMDGMYGCPQSLYQLKLVNRDVLAACYPEKRSVIERASPAYFDSTSENRNTITDQVMVAEAWHLKSGKNASDGRHVIGIENGILYGKDENFDDPGFPVVRFSYAPRTLGFWAQGLSEQLMGTQSQINQLLYTITTSLHLCGIPKWLVEDGSKVVAAHINNQIGGIIKYQGIKPELAAFQVLPPEIYAQLERLVTYAYQQSGISMLAAASQKPAGLNSGIALREYDDLQTDRFANLSQRYEKFYLDLADKMFRQAHKIAKRDGKYETLTPDKKGFSKIEFPKDLEIDDFVIQAFPTSALSKNPAQRKQEIVDLMQAGLIDPVEGRRLLDYPDLQQVEDLLNAPEERILKILDQIVEEGIYTPPDPFMDLQKAKQLATQYYNKYYNENLEEERLELLRNFSTQLTTLVTAAMPTPMGGMPQAAPQPQPVSDMVPNVAAPPPMAA